MSSYIKRDEGWPLYYRVVVVASFFVTFVAYGGGYSFGVFLKPLRESFAWTSAATSGAFSLLMFSYCGLAILSGLAVDRFGPRITIGVGGLLMGMGFLLTSQVKTLSHIYMTYGLLVGPGMSTAYTPVLTTISRWFTKWRGLALGIVTAGGGLGNFIVPPLASYFIAAHGWRLSYLIMGPVVGGIIITAALFLRKDPSQIAMTPNGQMTSEILDKDTSMEEARTDTIARNATGLSLKKALGTKTFWLLCSMYLMVGFGLQMMMVHVVPYVQEGPKLSPLVAATVLSTIGGASVVGRLIMGAASDRIGTKRALAIATSIEGVMIIGIMTSSNTWMLYLCAAVFGFGYGSHVPQFPALTGELFGLRRMGTILGTQSILYGVGGALGPFLAGYTVDTTGSYTNAFLLGATAMFLTAAFTFLLKTPKVQEP